MDTSVNVGHQPNGNSGTPNLSWIQFNVDYFKTRDGVLKLVQLVSNLICYSYRKSEIKISLSTSMQTNLTRERSQVTFLLFSDETYTKLDAPTQVRFFTM